MGILTNAVNGLISQVLDFGFDQLDNFVTRKIQEGQYEEAFQAADQWENDAIQRMSGAGQGGGILPTGPMDLVPSNQNMAAIQKSPLASEMVRARQQQFLQNDPYFLQQAAKRKQQESMQELNKQLGFETFKQNQGGTQTARDIFGGGDITQEQRNILSGQRTTALEDAKALAKEKAMARKAQLKPPMASPGAVTTRVSEAQGQGEIVSAVTPSDISRMEKVLMSQKDFSEETVDGKRLNVNGENVLNQAADILSRQKKKNPLLAIKQAKEQYQKETRTDTQAFTSFAGQRAPAKQPQITEPTPQQKATQMTNEQKIQILRQRGVPEEEIQKALRNK